jgi:hypothetical protein
MIIISHRGNTNGRDLKTENNPEHIHKLLTSGIDCEVDVWVKNDLIYLGHDEPTYKIDCSFLKNKKLWCHAKNLPALDCMAANHIINYFWHQTDDYTLTSSGVIWTHNNLPTNQQCIIVDLESNWQNKQYDCYGVCVDYFS